MKRKLVTFCETQFTCVFERKGAVRAAHACLAVVQKPPSKLALTFGDAILAVEETKGKLRPTGRRDLELAVSLCFAFYLEVQVGAECSVGERIHAMAEMGVPLAYVKLADPQIRRHITLLKP